MKNGNEHEAMKQAEARAREIIDGRPAGTEESWMQAAREVLAQALFTERDYATPEDLAHGLLWGWNPLGIDFKPPDDLTAALRGTPAERYLDDKPVLFLARAIAFFSLEKEGKK